MGKWEIILVRQRDIVRKNPSFPCGSDFDIHRQICLVMSEIPGSVLKNEQAAYFHLEFILLNTSLLKGHIVLSSKIKFGS